MKTMKTRKNKLLVILIVFMMLFSNFGYTISAIATSGEFEVISNGFFKKDEIKFKAYFEDEDGREIKEITKDVNQKVKLVVEVLPQVEGYLKEASLKAVSSNDDNINFKFTSVTENLLSNSSVNSFWESVLVDDYLEKGEEQGEEQEEPQEVKEQNTSSLQDVLVPEETEAKNEVAENTTVGNTAVENTTTLTNALMDGAVNPLSSASSTLGTEAQSNINNVENTTANNGKNPLQSALSQEEPNSAVTTEAVNPITPSEQQPEAPVVEEDVLVNEEEIIEQETKRSRIDEELRNAILDISVASENEISLSNITSDTKFEIELEYVQGETFNIEDLYKNVKLQLSGTFINENLEEIKVGKEEELSIGWEYSKDITLNSEYTKFSPFELEDIKGTIVENKIVVSRDITDEKYLPVKSTRLEITVPKVNGKNPIDVDVIANKLLATRGEDAGNTSFQTENWNYDELNGTINIFVENDNLVYSKGSDEYVIIYRYEDYISGESSNLAKNVKATVVEYSGRENNTLVKEINNSQDIKIDVGELVTYSISTNEETLNKGKIYANYNSEEALYETLFTTQVNVNILTSDILEQLKIDASKEFYRDVNGVELEALGVQYRQIKFNYSEITSILSNGGEIVITNTGGEVLYILNKDAIKKEEDCTVNLNSANGIHVYANNIATNGALNFEITKAIKKCNYDKAIFKSITQIESRVSAEVKYSKIDEKLQLKTIAVAKNFEESQTSATLSMSRSALSTINSNDNVELRIELNNDKETSDLYINPSFEIVFPKYVTSVEIGSIDLINNANLRINDFQTYTENDIVKLKIDLMGVQKTFCENSMTNGTNIIVNVNIGVNNYAPVKEDQIKMYYCNEGASTYQSQTKWSISKIIPNGILKTTNGFDVEVVKYQAPSGLIAINGIINYDGKLGELKSVKQGTVTQKVPTNSQSVIATMELLALNNTENTCSDVVLIGRVPFKGNKDVISGEDLGTTTDTKMLDGIKEDIQNGNTATIYYSTNPTADRNLDNIGNGWTTSIADMSTVRSYMIVVKGAVEAGSSLRYTYSFEIPEKLPYEAKITGTFGAFYNNQKPETVVFESSSADKVVLETEAGPKIEAKMTVDVGDGTSIGECRYMEYTLKVTNTGSIDAENVKISFPIPNNTLVCEYYDTYYLTGNNNFIISSNQNDKQLSLKHLAVGQTEEFKLYVKTNVLDTAQEYKEGKDVFIKAKATITAENLGITVQSNETSNHLVKSNLDLTISTNTTGIASVGDELIYKIIAINIAKKELNNIKVNCKIPNGVDYKNLEIQSLDVEYDKNNISYDEGSRTLSFVINRIKENSVITLNIYTDVKKASNEGENLYMEFTTEDASVERTTDCIIIYKGPILEVTQVSNSNSIQEREHAEFAIKITNNGRGDATGLRIIDDLSDYLDDVVVRYSGESDGRLSLNENNDIDDSINNLSAFGNIVITIAGTAKDLKDGKLEDKIINQAVITGDYIDSITTNESEIVLKQNPNKVDEVKEDNYEYVEHRETQEDSGDEQVNTNSQPQENNVNTQPQEEPTQNSQGNNNATVNVTKDPVKNLYSISGEIWFDENADGIKNNEEKAVSTVKVQLLKDDNMVQAVTSDGNGKYELKNLETGKYNVIFLYDAEQYTTTIYNKQQEVGSINSTAIETEEGMAITTDLEIVDSNLENISLGLKQKDTFDLIIGKYITKAKVKTAKDEKEYNFDDEDFAKVEIRSKELNGSTVDLEYKIVVKNIGTAEGNATKIVDMIPEGMTFDEKKNTGWYLGNDGYLYNEELKDITMEPNDELVLKLVLTRQMTEENTGVVNNKAIIKESINSNGYSDVSNNNVANQQVMITVGTGGTSISIIASIVVIILALIIYANRDKVKPLFSKKYNNSTKEKIKIKKVYK